MLGDARCQGWIRACRQIELVRRIALALDGMCVFYETWKSDCDDGGSEWICGELIFPLLAQLRFCVVTISLAVIVVTFSSSSNETVCNRSISSILKVRVCDGVNLILFRTMKLDNPEQSSELCYRRQISFLQPDIRDSLSPVY